MDKLNNNLKIIILLSFGSIFGCLIYLLPFDVRFYSIAIRPSKILFLSVWLISVEYFVKILQNKKNNVLNNGLLILSGVCFSIFTCYLCNNGNLYGNNNIYLNITLLILFYFLISFFLSYLFNDINIKNLKYSNKLLFKISVILMLIIFIVTRGGNILAHNLPNESRSLFIFGIEIHHLFTGFFLLGLSQVFLYFIQKKNIFFFMNFILYISSLSLIADEISYIMLEPLTDDFYFGTFSLFGAIISFIWIFYRIKKTL